MAFGKNYAEIVGRLGADVTINHLASGGRVANLSRSRPTRGISIATRARRSTRPSGTGSSPSRTG